MATAWLGLPPTANCLLPTAVHWLVYGDPVVQSLLCVALLIVVRDALAVRFRIGAELIATDFPPITILKPVHGVEPAADEAFRSYCALDYPAPYEVLFILEDERQQLYPLVIALAAEFPERVRCVLAGPHTDPLVNGKSHNLAAGAVAARYEWLLVSDSDTIADRCVLRRLAGPLGDPKVAAVAATPRVVRAHGLPARVERLLMNAVLAPFQYASAQVRGARGLWGTLLLLRRDAVDAAGGFTALGRYLTEDIALENALRRQALGGALVRRPVDVVCAEMRIGELLRHWQRWLVGLRRMRRGSYACVSLILLAYLMPVLALGSLLVVPGATVERLAAGTVLLSIMTVSLWLTGRFDLGVREGLGGYLLLAPAVIVLLAAYAWSLFDTTVVWRGRRLRIGPNGGIVSSEE